MVAVDWDRASTTFSWAKVRLFSSKNSRDTPPAKKKNTLHSIHFIIHYFIHLPRRTWRSLTTHQRAGTRWLKNTGIRPSVNKGSLLGNVWSADHRNGRRYTGVVSRAQQPCTCLGPRGQLTQGRHLGNVRETSFATKSKYFVALLPGSRYRVSHVFLWLGLYRVFRRLVASLPVLFSFRFFLTESHWTLLSVLSRWKSAVIRFGPEYYLARGRLDYFFFKKMRWPTESRPRRQWTFVTFGIISSLRFVFATGVSCSSFETFITTNGQADSSKLSICHHLLNWQQSTNETSFT